MTVAPFQVHLVLLKGKGSPETESLAEKMYQDLQAAGLEVLYDDRAESPGVKFNDADLLGMPIRLTVSERAYKAGGVEYKRRDLAEKEILPLENITGRLKRELSILRAEIDQQALTAKPYDF